MKSLQMKAIVAAIVLSTCSRSLLQAESIWSRRKETHSVLFFDTRARNVGDLVTIVIAQQTDVDNSENRALNKATTTGTSVDLETETGGGFGTQAADAALDFATTSKRNFNGKSNYQAEQGFTDRVTATVIAAQSNGNLVLSGHRDIQVAGDVRRLVFSGTIRSIDLTPQNTVNSRFIADFQLTYEGAGPEQAFTKQGWLGARVNRWWPF